MKIKCRNDNVRFDELDVGTVFKYDNEYYLKLETRKLPTNNGVNCVNLLENKARWFYTGTLVTPVEAELVIHSSNVTNGATLF